MPRKPQRPPVRQPTSPELLAELLRFVETHFYAGDPLSFIKDKPRLLEWVILVFARWLERRAVTLPAPAIWKSCGTKSSRKPSVTAIPAR